MLGFIEKLQKQPEAKRRKAHIMLTVSLSLLIALMWGLSHFISFGVSVSEVTNFYEASPMQSLAQTITVATGGIRDAFNDLVALVSGKMGN